MKNFLFCVLVLICFNAYSQNRNIEGVVNDAKTGKPLPFVNITVNNTKTGTSSDIDGKFRLKVPQKGSLLFSFIGYKSKTVLLDTLKGNFIQLSLNEDISRLNEVDVFPGENPAHRIIQNAVDHRQLNDPLNLNSFAYKSYSKFIVSLNIDSLNPKADNVEVVKKDTSYTQIDSSDFELISFMEKQDLFLMENVTERKFLAPSRDNETVIANKTSGFKNPTFALIATELQSFSFYEDYIRITGNEYLNPITPGSTKRYFFLLEDTLYNSASDTIFIISFRPRPDYGFKPLKGLLYINTSSWAIQNVLAEPFENEGVEVKIEQLYQRFDETWFPVQLNADLIFQSISINGIKPFATLRTYLSDININTSLKRRDIERVDISINTNDSALKVIDQYRVNPLSDKDLETYRVIDSLGEAENLDRRLGNLGTLLQGEIPLWWVDLELSKLFNYNTYEGYRLGLGGHTNNRLSRLFSIGGYFAYGFKDETWKYGTNAELILSSKVNLKLKGGYSFEILESGGLNFIQKPSRSLLENNYRRLYIENWDETEQLWTGIEYHPIPQVQTEWRLQNETRNIVDEEYSFQQTEGDIIFSPASFSYTEFVGSIRYAPKEEYIRIPDGIFTFKRAFPVFYLQYTQGFEGLWSGEYSYQKIDFSIEYQLRSISLGKTILTLWAGKVFNDVPYSKLYVHQANMINSNSFSDRLLSIVDGNSFETMRFNEFLSDQYIRFTWRQDFGSRLFRKGSFKPGFSLVNRFAIGDIANPLSHRGIEFSSIIDGYFESGFEFRNLLRSNFSGFGLGVFYRYGAYTLPEFADNLAIKLNFSFGT